MHARRIGAVATMVAMLSCIGTSVGLAVAHGELLGLFAPDLGAAVAFSSIGAFLLWRRAVPRIPEILCVQGSCASLTVLTGVIKTMAERSGPLHGISLWSAWLNNLVWLPGVVLLTVLVLLFPDGHLSSPRWRWLVAAVIGCGIYFATGSVIAKYGMIDGRPESFAPNPTGFARLDWLVDVGGFVAFLAMITCLGVSVGSLVVRRRRSAGARRAQLTALSFGVGVSVVLLAALTPVPGHASVPVFVLQLVTIAPIPVSIVVAVLRYRLFDIDRLVSRTVAYALVLAVLAGVYIGVVTGLAALVPHRYGQVGVAVATLTVAALAVPLAQRVRKIVDRRFNRARFDAEQVANAFAIRLRSRPDRGDVPVELLEVVESTVAPSEAGVWLAPTS